MEEASEDESTSGDSEQYPDEAEEEYSEQPMKFPHDVSGTFLSSRGQHEIGEEGSEREFASKDSSTGMELS